jgi:hypothetical protein
MPEKRFKLKSFQRPFFKSAARFPAFIAGWGTGKTMTMILKGVHLSNLYHRNLGMIFRKTEKSLRDSTISDFQDYTGLAVPVTNPRVEIPGTGSKILFGHADDMKGLEGMLQNINLGWIGIEQAEERESAAVFDTLRGRLRRVLTPPVEVQKRLVELGTLDRVVKDFREIPNDPPDKKLDRAIASIISDLDMPYNQFMIIGNTNGHNWIYRRWKQLKMEGYDLSEACSFDNQDHIPQTTLEDWERLKVENPKLYARCVMNSWEDYNIEGAYYAELMSDALKAGRVEVETLYDTGIPVYTFWDLGVGASDTTTIWFVQFVGGEIWLVDYHEEHGKGMNHYSKVLDRKPYTYGAHYLPPDATARLQGPDIVVRINVMRQLRREPVRLVERHRIEERIAVVRGILNRCKFSSKCNVGVNSLNNYKAKRKPRQEDDGTVTYLSKPDHTWASNGADAFGYMAMVYRYQKPDDDAFNEYTDQGEWIEGGDSDAGITDLLGVR